MTSLSDFIIAVQAVTIFLLIRRKRIARRAVRAEIKIEGASQMPLSLSVGATATAIFREFDAAGNQVPNAGPVAFTSSAPAIATVDPVTGVVTAVAPGTSVIAGLDSTDNLQASDTLTVTDVATSATLSLVANAAAPAAQAKAA